MMQEAMKNDTIREVVASEDSWIEVTGADGTDHSHSMDTHNYLLGQDGNIGGKTGTTDDAGYCFTSAYNRDDDEISHRRFELHHHRPALYRYRHPCQLVLRPQGDGRNRQHTGKDRQRQPALWRALAKLTGSRIRSIDATLPIPRRKRP